MKPTCLTAVLFLTIVAARGQLVETGPNLVVNGGFETGDTTGYTVYGSSTLVAPSSGGYFVAHSGTYYLSGGSYGTLGGVTQTVATVAGQQYRLSYYLSSDGNTPNAAQVSEGGMTLSSLTNIPASPYTLFTFDFTAASNSTLLNFGLRNDPTALLLDDISLFLLLNNIAPVGTTFTGTTFAATPGLTPNQKAVALLIDRDSLSANNNLTQIILALASLPSSSRPGAFSQLTPQAFGQFATQTAFNNASFETEAMDVYLENQRGADGNFLAGNGAIDSSGLTVNDPDYDPALQQVHSRMLAWNPAPATGVVSDVVDPIFGGVDMKDTKAMRPAPANAKDWNFFIRGSVILAQGSSSADVSHFGDDTAAVTLGADYRITPHFLVGLTAGYGHTDADLDEVGSSATVDSYSPGIYAAYADGGWYANAVGDYVHNAYTQDRAINFLSQTAHSAPNGNEGVASLVGGYDFHQGALTFGPLAGLQYTHLAVDGYQEDGSIADLSVNSQDADSLRSRLGGRISYTFAAEGLSFVPHLDASWQHEFMDQSRGITSQFTSSGVGSFDVRTQSPDRDSALIDAGLDAVINQAVTVFADYEVQAGQDNYFGQSVQAGVKIGF